MAFNRTELKKKGKELIRQEYGSAVLAGAILMIAALDSFMFSNNSGLRIETQGIFPTPSEFMNALSNANFFYTATFVLFVTFFFSVFIGNPMVYGARNWFKYHGQGKMNQDTTLFSGFHKSSWLRISACILWRDLICFCWGLLLIVPGIIKHYEYLFVPYILEEHPRMSSLDVMKYSSNLTKGHKMELFLLDLSFIGWDLLGVVTLGLSFLFYSGPYLDQSQACAYLSIQENIQSGRIDASYKMSKQNKKK